MSRSPKSPRLQMTAQPRPPLNAHFFFSALRQWWRIATPVALVLASIAAAIVWWTFVPQYKSTAILQIQPIRFVFAESRAEAKQFVLNQLELLRSRLVLRPVLEKSASVPELAMADDPLLELAKRLDVESMGQSDYYQLSYSGPDPETSALVVNAVAESYLNLRGEFDSQRTKMLLDLLDEERRERRQQVEVLRNEVRRLTKDATGQDPYNPHSGLIDNIPQRLTDLQARLTAAEVELAVAKAQLGAQENWLETNPINVSPQMVDMALSASNDVQLLHGQLEMERAKLKATAQTAAGGENSEPYRNQLLVVEEWQQKLDSLREELRPQYAQLAHEQEEANRERARQQLSLQVENQTHLRDYLQQQFGDELTNLKEYSSQTMLDLEFKKSELIRAEKFVDLIGDRFMQIRTEQRAPARVELLEKADVPKEPVEILPWKVMGMGVGGAVAFPFLLALLWELRVRRVSDVEQLELSADLPVVGEIARLPLRSTGVLVRRDRFDSDLWMFEESIDNLRTHLVVSQELKEMQIIAVTSACSQEGKTSVASQLAVSLARSTGETTLLIDGDMRSPDVHNVFDLENEIGLADLLQQEDYDPADVINDEWSDTLHILTAGQLRSNPHRLVGTDRFQALLQNLKIKYRYIVLDTPPLLAASEAVRMAQFSDTSLLCTMRNVSRVGQVKAAYRRLSAADAEPFGIVLSGVPTKTYAYKYGSYGYSRSKR